MQELAAKVPELRQIAYNMYADDYNRQLGLYDRGYQRFSDDFNRYMDQERFNYGLYDDRTKLGYQAYRDQVGDQQWQNQFDWTKSTDARDYARNVLTGDREYEANRADTKWNQEWTEKTYADQRADALRQENREALANLWDQVNRYGRIPSLAAVLAVGGTQADYEEMAAQGRHVRAADASKYYSGY